VLPFNFVDFYHSIKCNISIRLFVCFPLTDLPKTRLSTFMEESLSNLLHSKGITLPGRLTVRVLATTKKSTDVQPGMLSQYPDGPKTFPYVSKSIVVFQVRTCLIFLLIKRFFSAL